MKYLLIVFIVFLALAPLSHFVPSKRQRLIARLREYAALNGLFVEFRQPPGRSASAAGGATGARHIYYGKRLPYARSSAAVTRGGWVFEEGTWRPVNWRDPVPDPLSRLPAQAYAATVDEGSCGVYWDEAGGEVEVDLICSVLEDWARELRPAEGDFA